METQSKSKETPGTGPHKAVVDITISFRTELPPDDKSAHGLLEALGDFLRSEGARDSARISSSKK